MLKLARRAGGRNDSVPFDRAEVMGYSPKEDSIYYIFRHQVLPYIDPAPYNRALYRKIRNRPANTAVKIGVLLLFELEWRPLEEFAEYLKTDIAYQYALNITLSTDVILSYSALPKFKRRLVLYLARKGDDLVHGTFVQLAKHYCGVLGVDMDTVRIDSFLLDINAPALSRLQLIYVCTEDFVSALAKEGIEVAEQVRHFLDPGDYNYVTYHDTDIPEETKMERLLADASFVMDHYAQDHKKLPEYRILDRCLYEQTFVDENGIRRLREKGDPVLKGEKPYAALHTQEGEDDVDSVQQKSGILQTPTDPDATFYGKRGEQHRGYSGSVLEARCDRGPIIIDYDLAKNIVADNRMAVVLMNGLERSENGGAVVGDAAFCGEALHTATQNRNHTQVNAALTGHRTPTFLYRLEPDENLRVIKCPVASRPKRFLSTKKYVACSS